MGVKRIFSVEVLLHSTQKSFFATLNKKSINNFAIRFAKQNKVHHNRLSKALLLI